MRPRRWTPYFRLMFSLALCISLVRLTHTASANALGAEDEPLPTRNSKLSPQLEAMAAPFDSGSDEGVRVIVQTRALGEQAGETIISKGGRIKRSLSLINGYVAEVPRSSLRALALDEETLYVSLDRPTALLQSDRYDNNLVRVTTGAENVIGRNGISSNDKDTAEYLKGLRAGPNGRDVTVAILDSGIYDDGPLHEDLRAINNPHTRRVLAHRNFVASENLSPDQLARGYDPYGHGTHVAGIAAGSGRECLQDGAVGNFYAGMAMNANLVDLRVVGADGSGSISNVIAAIEWMIANRTAYNIRVANFSIGAAVTESYKSDPLCQAVERAVRAGIVCVVAAGNFGKDALGNAVYGGILAPGNDPLAITVGATNTWGTAVRSDDMMASYSSRGPALVDFVCKPDLVAPGTLLRSVAANRNSLAAKNNLTVYSKGGEDMYMWLSGTSMAAPVVAGAAALMLDANPSLTPAMVKSVLQFTAQQLPSLSGSDPLLAMLTEGAGYLNADAAVRMAQAFAHDANVRADGSPLLSSDTSLLDQSLYKSQRPGASAFTSNIAGETISWGDNILFSHGLAYLYNNGRLSVLKTAGWQVSSRFLLVNGYLGTNGRMLDDSRLMDSSRLMGDARLTIDLGVTDDSRVTTDGWLWSSSVNGLMNPASAKAAWGANLMDPRGTVLADGTVLGDGSMLSDGSVLADHAKLEQVMAWGDDAPGFDIKRIESKRHPLYPRGKKIRY
jgi:serine protease AprX